MIITYNEDVMQAVRQNMGLDESDTSRDNEIMEMSGYEILDRYLTWNGIIGYTRTILDVVSEAFPETADVLAEEF